MILVIGSAVIRNDALAEALALSMRHVLRSRAEPGCLSHAVHQDVEFPNRLVFFEEWQDRAALEEHFRVPASREFAAALTRLCVEPPRLAAHEVADRAAVPEAVESSVHQHRSGGSSPTIRRAAPGDARRLAEIAEATFRAAFADTNSAENMDLHCHKHFGEQIQAAEIADPAVLTLLCEDAGRLVGYVQLCWGAAPDCVAARRPGEIRRLYVVADRHGQGVARTLMDAGLEELRRRGSDAIWLGVWERNPRAIAFYRKYGFVEVGEHRFLLGSDPQRDIVMVQAAPQ